MNYLKWLLPCMWQNRQHVNRAHQWLCTCVIDLSAHFSSSLWADAQLKESETSQKVGVCGEYVSSITIQLSLPIPNFCEHETAMAICLLFLFWNWSLRACMYSVLINLNTSLERSTEIFLKRLKAGFHTIADDRRRTRITYRRSQTIAKQSCFHIIADVRKRSQSRLLHTFRTAEVSKSWHASCAREKIAANKMTDVEREILLQANLFFFWSTDFEFLLAHLAPIQKAAFSIASDNDHAHFLYCGTWPTPPPPIN